ncbi:MAG TPA: hypothetical protein VMF35_15435 [Acidimicrobiales bacterium]|nr:hypothetical protein [Acidimicrobiales bacterium]
MAFYGCLRRERHERRQSTRLQGTRRRGVRGPTSAAASALMLVVVFSALAAPCATAALSTTPTTLHGPGPVPTTRPSPRPAAPATTTTTPAATQPTATLERLAFFNPDSGYGLFVNQGSPTCGASVASTSDGGASFAEPVPVTTWSCSASPLVGALAFDDHGDGFAYGPDLYETHDGGATWSRLPQFGAVLSVEALGYSVWMVEAGCPISTTPPVFCPLDLLESQDGGLSWKPVPTPPATSLYGGEASNPSSVWSGQTWLLRLTQSSAFLSSGVQLATNGTPTQDPVIWSTEDDGQTWSARRLPCGLQPFSVALSAAPDGTLFAVCAGQAGAGNSLKSVLRSTDGGLAWATIFPCALPGAPAAAGSTCATSVLSGGYLGAIDAVSGSTVFLVGPRSPLLVTRDGGASWTRVVPGGDEQPDFTDTVTFFNASDGVVLGTNGLLGDQTTIWSTSDGGSTWTALVPAPPGQPAPASLSSSPAWLLHDAGVTVRYAPTGPM